MESRTSGAAAVRRGPPAPRTIDHSGIDLDIFGDLLSFYARSVVLKLNQDLDARMDGLPVARGTGKISTLLLVGANPGIRPSVVAHYISKDRSAMVRLLDQLQAAGLIEQRVSASERRARELYLTKAGEALRSRVQAIALGQDEAFFAALTPEEHALLLSLLKKLYAVHVTSLPDGVDG